jgi:hypothetical protein
MARAQPFAIGDSRSTRRSAEPWLPFWFWIWGAMGVILAVPVMGAAKIVCDTWIREEVWVHGWETSHESPGQDPFPAKTREIWKANST